MTFLQIQNKVYNLLRDPLKTKYSLQDVKDYINDAERQFCIETEYSIENVNTITTINGQREYDLPADYGILKGVYYDNTQLHPIDIEATMTSTTANTQPNWFYVRRDKIGFEAVPDKAYTIKLLYYSIGGGLEENTDTTIVPAEYATLLMYGAAFPLALGADDERAEKFFQLFNQGIEKAKVVNVKKNTSSGFPKIGQRNRSRGLDRITQDIYGIT